MDTPVSTIPFLQWIAIIFALFALSRSILRFRDRQTNWKDFLLWSGIWVAVIIVSINPNITYYFAHALGINRGIDLIIYISIIVLFYLMFRLYIKIDKVEKSITLLTRSNAISHVKKKK